jgi:hypothetical protein
MLVIIGSLLVLLIWALTAPSSSRQFWENLWLAVMRPIAVVQNLFAEATRSLDTRLSQLANQAGDMISVVGTFLQLFVFTVLTISGFFVTALTLAGMFGRDLDMELPARLEILTGASLIIGIAYLIGIILEVLGFTHFGQWNNLKGEARKLILIFSIVLIVLGIVVIYHLGTARFELERLTSAELEASSGSTAIDKEINESLEMQSLPGAARWVMIGLPLFVDLTAALAMWGALRTPIAVGIILIWGTRLVLTLLNLIPFILYQVFDALRGATLSLHSWLGAIGRWTKMQREEGMPPAPSVSEPPPHLQVGSSETSRLPIPAGRSAVVQMSPTPPPVPTPPTDPPEPPLPEMDPVEPTDLDPLGCGGLNMNTE